MALRPLLMLAAACGLLAAPAAVPAAVLIEAQKAGEPLRLVVDRARELVLVTSGGRRMLVDLAGGLVHLQQGDGAARRTHARFRPGHDEPAPYRVELFGPGPMVAGNGSSYHVLFDLERVCAETMLSGWMAPFVDPAVRAIALLEQLSAPAAGRCLRRDPVYDLRRGGLAADGRQGRPPDLRHHGDPLRLRRRSQASCRHRPRRARSRSRISRR